MQHYQLHNQNLWSSIKTSCHLSNITNYKFLDINNSVVLFMFWSFSPNSKSKFLWNWYFIKDFNKTEIKCNKKTFFFCILRFYCFFRSKKHSSRHSWMPSRTMPCYTLQPGNKHHDHKMRYECVVLKCIKIFFLYICFIS